MFKTKCLICDEEFLHKLKGKEKHQLRRHIGKKHSISYEEYIIKYFHNGKHPKCSCGCEKEVRFFKGEFHKYFEDHKNKMKMAPSTKKHLSDFWKNKNKEESSLVGLTKKELKKYWDLYKKEEISLRDLQKISGVDLRTIKKYWFSLDIANEEDFIKKSKSVQASVSQKKRKQNYISSLDNELLTEIIDYLYKEKVVGRPVSISKCISDFSLNISSFRLRKALSTLFGNKALKLFKNHNVSQEEVELLYVFRFYFGEKNVIHSFPLKNKIYDFLIFGNILVEYDGDFWHGVKSNNMIDINKVRENDANKDKIAKENGYKIFRINTDNLRNFKVIGKIIDMRDN